MCLKQIKFIQIFVLGYYYLNHNEHKILKIKKKY